MKKVISYVILLAVGVFCMIYLSNQASFEKRIEFIESFGWIIDENSVIIENVRIPDKPFASYSDYAKIQKKSEFNLDALRGKTLKRYTYSIKNHQDKYAVVNIFELKGKIVAADVLSPKIDGIIHPINERTYQNAS